MAEITHHATRSAQLVEDRSILDAYFTGDGSATTQVRLGISGGDDYHNYGRLTTTLESLRHFMAALEQEACLARQQNCH